MGEGIPGRKVQEITRETSCFPTCRLKLTQGRKLRRSMRRDAHRREDARTRQE